MRDRRDQPKLERIWEASLLRGGGLSLGVGWGGVRWVGVRCAVSFVPSFQIVEPRIARLGRLGLAELQRDAPRCRSSPPPHRACPPSAACLSRGGEGRLALALCRNRTMVRICRRRGALTFRVDGARPVIAAASSGTMSGTSRASLATAARDPCGADRHTPNLRHPNRRCRSWPLRLRSLHARPSCDGSDLGDLGSAPCAQFLRARHGARRGKRFRRGLMISGVNSMSDIVSS